MTNIFHKLLTKLGLLKKHKDNGKDNNYQETYQNTKSNYSNYDNALTSSNAENTKSATITQMEMKNTHIKTETQKIYDVAKISAKQINTIWDVIKARENTQAEHIINCLPDDEWIDMEDLKNRIKLQYNVEYQNEKSLYPYIKTLTDINLIKLNNSGKKRTWKKNIIIIEKE
jgi:hypothetical protein